MVRPKIIIALALGLLAWPMLPVAGQTIVQAVPFTAQAPLAQWSDKRQQDGCEEAAAAMAMAWVKGEKGKSKAEWRTEILAISDFEKKEYGEYRDISLKDIKAWIFTAYYDYDGVSLKTIGSADEIREELEKGKLVLAPMNGRQLKNPYFTAPGPERHMVLIKGYDYATKQFISNDPGTRRGEDYRYPAKVIFKAIRAYTTGYHGPFAKIPKQVLVVSPKTVDNDIDSNKR